MDRQLAPLDEVLGKLPWFGDLTAHHREQLLRRVRAALHQGTAREQYAALLQRWVTVAHRDAKWSRFELLRESGLLAG